MEDSLSKRYSIKLASAIVAGIINAIIIAIVPKALGPIVYGQFVYLQQFFTQIMGLLDMGSSTAFFAKLSARQERKELIVFYFLFALVVLILLISLFGMVLMFDFGESLLPNIPNDYIYLGLFFGFFTWFSQIFIKISDAYALTVSVELVKIWHKLLTLLLLLFFVYQSSFSLDKYFYFHYISLSSFLLIVGWIFYNKNILNTKLISLNFEFKSIIREFVEYCHPLFVYSIVSIAASLFDIWLLQSVAGSEQMGFYGLAYSLAAVCFLFTGAMTPIITREFSKSYEQKDLHSMRKLFSRYVPMLYSVAAFFSIFMSFQSENMINIFTDELYKDAYLALMIMALYPMHQTYGQLIGSVLFSTEQTKLYRNIGVVSALIGVSISFFTIYILNLSALGLAYKMVIGQFISVNILFYFVSKFLDIRIKSIAFHQVYAILFFAVIGYLSSNLIELDSPLFEFIVSGLIYTIMVMVCTYCIPQVFAITREEINRTIKKVII